MKDSHAFALAIGIGVPFAIICLLCFIWFFHQQIYTCDRRAPERVPSVRYGSGSNSSQE